MYYFWDNWLLYHKCIFDGPNRLITVAPGTTALSIKTDLYSDWKEWVATYDNSKYLPAVRTIGGDPLGEQKYAGDIYFLINNWRLVIDLTAVRVTGALFSDNFETAFWTTQEITGTLIPQYPATVAQLVQTVATVVPTVTGSPETIAQRVWDSLTSAHTVDGTFGKLLQNMPLEVWSMLLATSFPAGSTGEKLKQVLTTGNFIALK